MSRTLVLGTASLVAIACNREPAATRADAAPPASSSAGADPCGVRVGEKLGIKFVKVCSADAPRAHEGLSTFWISAPLPCSAGEHDNVRCPTITPLERARPGLRPIAARSASVIDKVTAHRLCSLRVGGRLPTRAERAQARELAGIATLVVTESDDPAQRFRAQELAEWVTDEACVQPSVPEDTCRFSTFPATSLSGRDPFPWSATRSCVARPVDADASIALDFGAPCAAKAWSWGDGGVLPCGVKSPASALSGFGAFALECAAPASTPVAHPKESNDEVAAFRCVVTDSAIATFGEAAEKNLMK